uniref:Ig-like domain-containing protein n=1 Tax=Mola mola TaxID=94237 RepID=A0A3Q3X1X9_MOLML
MTRNLIAITALSLCSLGWMSVSVSECQTVEVSRGEEVTLRCSNYTSSPTQIIWLKLSEPASFCSGFQSGQFEMRSNLSAVFLKIKQADPSDPGLYFCGYLIQRNPIIVSSIYLEVHDIVDGITKHVSVVVGSLSVFLIMNQGPDDLNYSAVTFCLKPKCIHQPASEGRQDAGVLYSAVRKNQEAPATVTESGSYV